MEAKAKGQGKGKLATTVKNQDTLPEIVPTEQGKANQVQVKETAGEIHGLHKVGRCTRLGLFVL